MSTLTMMERTATGWRCPRCGSTQEDTILPVRVAECNCAGIDAQKARDEELPPLPDWVDPSEAWEREDL